MALRMPSSPFSGRLLGRRIVEFRKAHRAHQRGVGFQRQRAPFPAGNGVPVLWMAMPPSRPSFRCQLVFPFFGHVAHYAHGFSRDFGRRCRLRAAPIYSASSSINLPRALSAIARWLHRASSAISSSIRPFLLSASAVIPLYTIVQFFPASGGSRGLRAAVAAHAGRCVFPAPVGSPARPPTSDP